MVSGIFFCVKHQGKDVDGVEDVEGVPARNINIVNILKYLNIIPHNEQTPDETGESRMGFVVSLGREMVRRPWR